uniref:Uncharacterized protein n=2 Tax=Oryza TaxID=4527 RepID=A0A0E0Q7A5_ORYRU
MDIEHIKHKSRKHRTGTLMQGKAPSLMNFMGTTPRPCQNFQMLFRLMVLNMSGLRSKHFKNYSNNARERYQRKRHCKLLILFSHNKTRLTNMSICSVLLKASWSDRALPWKH